MEWTIIRPGGLKNEAQTGRGVLTEDANICGAISREDVAELVVKALFSNKANGKVTFVHFSFYQKTANHWQHHVERIAGL
jgi:hypothetical protein